VARRLTYIDPHSGKPRPVAQACLHRRHDRIVEEQPRRHLVRNVVQPKVGRQALVREGRWPSRCCHLVRRSGARRHAEQLGRRFGAPEATRHGGDGTFLLLRRHRAVRAHEAELQREPCFTVKVPNSDGAGVDRVVVSEDRWGTQSNIKGVGRGMCIHPSIHLSIYPSIYLSIYLSIELTYRCCCSSSICSRCSGGTLLSSSSSASANVTSTSSTRSSVTLPKKPLDRTSQA
jgi:hypothetical protein